MQPHLIQRWQQAERLMGARDHASARPLYEALLDDAVLAPMAALRLSLIASAQGRQREAVDKALLAYSLRQQDPDLLEMLAKRLLVLGETRAALECATAPAMLASGNAVALAELGKLMSDHVQPDEALLLLRRAMALGLDSAAIRYLVGLSLMYSGDDQGAEAELGASLAQDPDFVRSARILSKLRTQTAQDNHVDALRASLARIGEAHADAPLLQYALFKELDDLGRTEEAWAALESGMALRRAQLRYDPAAEERLFGQLAQVAGTGDNTSFEGPVPIFIIGMPRSGTTLLERILGAHAQVADGGELRDFIFQLRWVCDRAGGPHLDADLARRAEDADWAELGGRYLSHTQWRAGDKAFYTDKMPANFSCAGYIAKALPQARILHMVRDPMDTCFSNIKELFANAYTHSYDQREMAEHFHRYRQLMAHWQDRFPGRILDVHYDALVEDPERVAREVMAFCGLPWQEGLVNIERRTGTVATASTRQVREPIHQRFRGQWRRYASQLQPLAARLRELGYDVPA